MMRWPTLLVVVALFVGGCGSDRIVRKSDSQGSGTNPTSGQSASAQSEQVRFRSGLGPEAKQILTYFDSARAEDPCGRLNPAAVQAIGKVTYFGVGSDRMHCQILFEESTVPGSVSEITVTTGYMSRGDGIDGLRPARNNCIYREAIGPSMQGNPLLLYIRADQSYDTRGDNGAALCNVVDGLLKSSADTVKSPRPLKGSRWMPQDRLSTIDPCAAANAIYPNNELQILPTDPFSCVLFEKSAEKDTDRRRRVDFEFTDISSAPRPKEKGPRLTRILGVLTKTEARGQICAYTAFPDIDDPLTGADSLSKSKQWISSIAVRSPIINNSCAEAEKLATEAVRLYQQR